MIDPPVTLYHSTTPPSAYLWAAGKLDLRAAADLTGLLRDTVACGCRVLRVDLAAVTFMDATCVEVFVSLRRRLNGSGDSLRFVGASSCVRQLFALADLQALLGPTRVPLRPDRPPLGLTTLDGA